MNFSAIFKKKPVIRPESVSNLKKSIVEVSFSDWIQELKRDAPDTIIRIKKTEKLTGQARGYIGNPIPVSAVEAATFDRMLFDSFGGGSFVLEYWNNGHLLMMKNSDPERPVTHTIEVAGYEKPLPGKRTATEAAVRPPQGPFSLMMRHLDTPEGIASLTGLLTLAGQSLKDILSSILSTKQSGGGVKEIIETISAVTAMMPAPLDEIEQLERFERIRSTLTAGARPPVNIGNPNSGSGSGWDSIGKAISSILVALATAQQQKPVTAQAQNQLGATPAPPAAGEIPAHLQISQPTVTHADPVASPDQPGVTASAQGQQQDPGAALINAKITAIKSGMKLNMAAESVANEIWSLLVYIVENGIVDQSFVDGLNADPFTGFDHIIRAYVPESKEYPQIDKVKQIVVSYILEDNQQSAASEQKQEEAPEESPEESPEEAKRGIISMAEAKYDTTEEAPVEMEQEVFAATED